MVYRITETNYMKNNTSNLIIVTQFYNNEDRKQNLILRLAKIIILKIQLFLTPLNSLNKHRYIYLQEDIYLLKLISKYSIASP